MKFAFIAALLLVATGCGTPPPNVIPDDQWYAPAVTQLVELNRAAEKALAAGKSDDASALVQKGQPLATQLLGVTKPTLAAMEAASDLDHIYGRMLMGNRHYGWARMQFQKNAARWKHWEPQTDETARRRKEAEASIAECDRLMSTPVQ